MLHQLTLAEIARALADKQFSAEELTRTLLGRIRQLDPQLNSFISITDDLAIAQAKAADERRANGENGALLGAPIAHKDLFCTQGVRTSCGSKMLDNFVSPYDATVVEKLAGLDSRIADAVLAVVEELKTLGATVKDISLPNMQHAIPAYYVIAPAEASSNLSRFDGVRYGYRCDAPQNLEDLYKRSRAEGFGSEVKNRIMVGTYALSAGYYDAYYLQAQKIRRLIKNDFVSAFAEVDVILGPTTPNPAWKIGEKNDDPVSQYLEDIYTITANLAGLPGLSMPAGFVDGLPVGVQLLAPYFQEGRLLNVAHQYQQVSDWHTRTPAGF